MSIFSESKPVLPKIRVAAEYSPALLSPSDSAVKGSNIFDTASASPDSHDTPSVVVHAISGGTGGCNISARAMRY